MASRFKYTVIIPVKEFNKYLKQCLVELLAVGRTDVEIIVILNDDDILIQKRYPAVKFIKSGKVSPAIKRDMAAKIAKGKFLVFLDDDSYPKKNYFNVADKLFIDDKLKVVGGPGITPKKNTFWQKVSGAVFVSKFVGGYPERYISHGRAKQIIDWPSVNLIVEKIFFKKSGGFGSQYWPGEDTFLFVKLLKIKKNFIFLYHPNLVVFHHRRSSLRHHLKQVGNYGLHRGYFARKYPENSRKLLYFVPSAFFIYINFFILFNFYSAVNDFFFLGIVAYAISLILGLFDIYKVFKNISICLVSLPYIFLTHYYYGFMFIKGFLSKNLQSKLR